ncbi:MAG: hypothetical protein HKN05_21705, partial [Rhizobiales bacterium]|nr:hypothetical protein [Hyphomicrobiales bacterium]
MNFRYPLFKLALPALMIAVLAPNPVSAQSQAQWNSLYDRIIRVEAAVRNMQGQTYNQGGTAAQNPQGAAQLNLRISSLEDQVRQLLGSMERLTRDLQQSRQDNEVRLRRLETAAREGRLRGKLKKYADAGSRAGTPATNGSSAGTLTLAPLQNHGGTAHTGGATVYDQGSLDNLVQDELVFESELLPDDGISEPRTGGTTVTGTATPIAPAISGSNSSRVQAPGPTTLGTITLRPDGAVTGGSVNTLPSTRDVVEKRTLDGEQVASLTTGSGPELVYEQAYENMLGRRFGAAEAGFE